MGVAEAVDAEYGVNAVIGMYDAGKVGCGARDDAEASVGGADSSEGSDVSSDAADVKSEAGGCSSEDSSV